MDQRRYKLSDTQQYVLQVFMNRCVVDHTDFRQIYSRALKKFEINDADLTHKEVYSQFIREINEAIHYYNFEIRKCTCEITGLTFYCFVRLFDSCSIGKLSCLYTPTELKIFQIVLPMIIESDKGYVSNNEIVNRINDTYEDIASQAQTQAQTITKIPNNREIRAAIEMFINHFWLVEVYDRGNMITLHGRALIELEQYLKESFPEDVLTYCFRCKKMVLIGLDCVKCNQRFHRLCAKEIFVNHNACINCKAVFDDNVISKVRDSIANARVVYNQNCDR